MQVQYFRIIWQRDSSHKPRSAPAGSPSSYAGVLSRRLRDETRNLGEIGWFLRDLIRSEGSCVMLPQIPGFLLIGEDPAFREIIITREDIIFSTALHEGKNTILQLNTGTMPDLASTGAPAGAALTGSRRTCRRQGRRNPCIPRTGRLPACDAS